MWQFLELEEQIGRYWHRLVGQAASYPYHPEAAVTLDSVRASLSVFFRGLGGTPGLELAAGLPQSSGHRLGLRQRLGLDQERLPQAARNPERLLLPAAIGCFPSASLNRRLYFWLAAFFALAEESSGQPPSDPLQADLAFLHQAYGTSLRVCRRYPGLAQSYQILCAALRELRPQRSLPPQEQAVEAVILALLGAKCSNPLGNAFLAAAMAPEPDFSSWRASKGYHPFLPVPLWGEINGDFKSPGASSSPSEQADGSSHQEGEDSRRRQAQRGKYEQSERDDPLLLNRFEKLISWAEMVNVNRAVEDEDEDAAKEVADTMEELALGSHQRRAATKLKFDLDLAPNDVDPSALIAELAYPEWDYRRQSYHEDHCRVVSQVAGEEGELWEPNLQARRRLRRIRRQFEALRPKRERLRRQLDGTEPDMDALVRAHCDLVASGSGSDRVYLSARQQARDLAVAMLVDVSLSTDSWVDNRQVLEVEKEALTAMASGLATCGDAFAIYTFTSRKRHFVRVATVKDFAAPFSSQVLRRIAALRPGYYTRMGAALRHIQQQLALRPERHRLLLLLSDGKPNDLDHYEGRYGIEDTRQAILEARRAGLAVFGITIDRKAQDYFPYLFGRGGYAIVARPDCLPQALPMLYQQLVG
ncbi:von Willebrand factor type A [Nitrosococcus halophilus Nc 4]|uniref:von Willebrand factor type A n=1 Tax=Nitrosococcus halophilus (strain Nc4) TaxID=472759 RepID=D5C1R4_NITHN|nr:VWA domain-containing protein [Nitrosococcus halophilus]ADE14697.1 von Willebrand factor type A [Nitrosococcus halophilus Nc 4]